MARFLPGFIGGGPQVLSSLSFVTSASSSGSATIAVPAETAVGDLMVLWDTAENMTTNAPAATLPSGFTSAVNFTVVTVVRMQASVKIATAGDLGATLTGMMGTAPVARKRLAVFRGNIPFTSMTIGGAQSEGTANNPSSKTILSSGGTPPLIVLGLYKSDASIDPRTMTPTKDGEAGSGSFWLAYKFYTSSPADVLVDMDDEGGANGLAGFYVSLA